jgi:hypothetical protein
MDAKRIVTGPIVGGIAMYVLGYLIFELITPSIAQGFVVGGVVGFLLWFGVDFIRYGMTNVPTLARTLHSGNIMRRRPV